MQRACFVKGRTGTPAFKICMHARTARRCGGQREGPAGALLRKRAAERGRWRRVFTWAAHLAEDLWYGRCGVGAAARCSAQQRRVRQCVRALAAVGLRLQLGRRLHVATSEQAAGAGSGPGPRCKSCRFREELDRAAGSGPQQAPS